MGGWVSCPSPAARALGGEGWDAPGPGAWFTHSTASTVATSAAPVHRRDARRRGSARDRAAGDGAVPRSPPPRATSCGVPAGGCGISPRGARTGGGAGAARVASGTGSTTADPGVWSAGKGSAGGGCEDPGPDGPRLRAPRSADPPVSQGAASRMGLCPSDRRISSSSSRTTSSSSSRICSSIFFISVWTAVDARARTAGPFANPPAIKSGYRRNPPAGGRSCGCRRRGP